MLTVKVTAGLTEGTLTGGAEVFRGTVVAAVVEELRVDFVSKGEDDVGEILSVVT